MSTDERETATIGDVRGGPRLMIVTSGGTRSHPLPRGRTLVLGRSSGADVVIDETSISRRHASLELGEQLMLTDLGSRNGSRVRGASIEPHVPVVVDSGDVVELGDVVVIVQLGPDGAGTRGSTNAPETTTAMQDVLRMADRAAPHRLNVLILGETGVGKGRLAQRIHERSSRRDAPMVVVNCAALAGPLLESELFGHEEGAFTGANRAKPGLLTTADGGTAFLDEIGEIALEVQVKLLRAIEDKTIIPVGGVRPRTIDVRFVAATHRDLGREIEQGRFRSDLYYRLNGISLTIPPLRQRRDEILTLAESFLEEAAEQLGASVPRLAPDARRWLTDYDWPGNIRELRNVIERAFVLVEGDRITAEHLRSSPTPTPTSMPKAVAPTGGSEREQILAALEACAGNQTQAAKRLGISRRTLITRLDRYGLPRPRKRK